MKGKFPVFRGDSITPITPEDETITFGESERDANLVVTRYQHALQMAQMGFTVTLKPNGNFVFSEDREE